MRDRIARTCVVVMIKKSKKALLLLAKKKAQRQQQQSSAPLASGSGSSAKKSASSSSQQQKKKKAAAQKKKKARAYVASSDIMPGLLSGIGSAVSTNKQLTDEIDIAEKQGFTGAEGWKKWKMQGIEQLKSTLVVMLSPETLQYARRTPGSAAQWKREVQKLLQRIIFMQTSVGDTVGAGAMMATLNSIAGGGGAVITPGGGAVGAAAVDPSVLRPYGMGNFF